MVVSMQVGVQVIVQVFGLTPMSMLMRVEMAVLMGVDHVSVAPSVRTVFTFPLLRATWRSRRGRGRPFRLCGPFSWYVLRVQA